MQPPWYQPPQRCPANTMGGWHGPPPRHQHHVQQSFRLPTWSVVKYNNITGHVRWWGCSTALVMCSILRLSLCAPPSTQQCDCWCFVPSICTHKTSTLHCTQLRHAFFLHPHLSVSSRSSAADNQLTGSIPASWGALPNLYVINVTSNQAICGGVPSSVEGIVLANTNDTQLNSSCWWEPDGELWQPAGCACCLQSLHPAHHRVLLLCCTLVPSRLLQTPCRPGLLICILCIVPICCTLAVGTAFAAAAAHICHLLTDCCQHHHHCYCCCWYPCMIAVCSPSTPRLPFWAARSQRLIGQLAGWQ